MCVDILPARAQNKQVLLEPRVALAVVFSVNIGYPLYESDTD